MTPPLSTVYLAKYYFPKVVRPFQYLGQQNTGALIGSFSAWKAEGVSAETIRDMIDEFCLHPDWSRGKPAWKVFLARREQLAVLVSEQAHQESEREK